MRTFPSFIISNHSLSLCECFYWGFVSCFGFGPTFLCLPPPTHTHPLSHILTRLCLCLCSCLHTHTHTADYASAALILPHTYSFIQAYPAAAYKVLYWHENENGQLKQKWSKPQRFCGAVLDNIVIFFRFSSQTTHIFDDFKIFITTAWRNCIFEKCHSVSWNFFSYSSRLSATNHRVGVTHGL